ncbi:winged helix-turn-helix domain-containing protein [Kitasatospora sp. NPDC093679]|uniref:winged helix-turn-helix domain-containing protein n=1 Tax=Kitasatospora sp. NPDC093679 TaxID=3154983 RepID=UPI0034313EFC
MIRAGRNALDRDAIAQKAGLSVGTIRNKKLLADLTPVSRPDARKELFDAEQAQVVIDNYLAGKRGKRSEPAPAPKRIPSLPDYDDFNEDELRGHLRAFLDAEQEIGFEHGFTADDLESMNEEQLRATLDGLDLLDLEEARLSIPEDRRPTQNTMEAYYYGSKSTGLPDADRTIGGIDHWYRSTMRRWNEQERRRRGGPTLVSRQVVGAPALESGEDFRLSEELREQAVQLVRDNETASPESLVKTITAKLGLSESAAWRCVHSVRFATQRSEDVRALRLAAAWQALAENPEITGVEFARQMGIGITAGNRYLNDASKLTTPPQMPAAPAAPEDTAIATPAEPAADERLEQVTRLITDNPQISTAELAKTLGVSAPTARKYRKKAEEALGGSAN